MITYQEFLEHLQNPKIKNRIRIFFHSLYILAFLFLYVPAYNISWPLEFPGFFYRDVFEYGLTSLFVYVLYFLKGKWAVNKKYPLLAGLISLMLVSLITIAYFKNTQPHLSGPSFASVFDDMMQYLGFGGLLFLTFLAIDHLDYIFSSRYLKIKEALDETRNQLLRQQFHPHFLFNALNSVYSMSLNNHPSTPDTILKLSGMMRYLTDEVNLSRIPIERELKFLKEYIAIEKIRFGEKANIIFETEGESNEKFIEPLLLIPLVENAFKHGFYTNNSEAFVHIILKLEDKVMKFTVQNSILSNKPEKYEEREGKGLDNLKNRLQLSYPKTSRLSLTEQNKVYLAELELKLES